MSPGLPTDGTAAVRPMSKFKLWATGSGIFLNSTPSPSVLVPTPSFVASRRETGADEDSGSCASSCAFSRSNWFHVKNAPSTTQAARASRIIPVRQLVRSSGFSPSGRTSAAVGCAFNRSRCASVSASESSRNSVSRKSQNSLVSSAVCLVCGLSSSAASSCWRSSALASSSAQAVICSGFMVKKVV